MDYDVPLRGFSIDEIIVWVLAQQKTTKSLYKAAMSDGAICAIDDRKIIPRGSANCTL